MKHVFTLSAIQLLENGEHSGDAEDKNRPSAAKYGNVFLNVTSTHPGHTVVAIEHWTFVEVLAPKPVLSLN